DRSLRPWLVAVYVAAGLFTLSTAGALVLSPLDRFVESSTWNLIYLGVFFPFFLLSYVLVFLRRREVQTEIERNAANFVAFGIAVAVVMGFTELVHRFWDRIPALGYLGSLLCTLILAVAILRHRLLEK